MSRVGLGFVALTENVPSGREAEYLAWHTMEHMPEMYSVPGLVNAQRWRSTAACRRERAAEVAALVPVENVVCYLMEGAATYKAFRELNQTLNDRDTHPEPSPYRMLGLYELRGARAAARVRVSDGVVPMRPNRGIYLVVERLEDRPEAERSLGSLHDRQVPAMLDTPGVAGVWWFATAPTDEPGGPLAEGSFWITLCFLDEDVIPVGTALRPLFEERWRDAPVEPWLAGPFESMVHWDWARFLAPE